MSISLVILAAGLGTRFQGGSKQTANVGPNGQMIFEYSIHDAIEAGFQKIIFIIRKDMESSFQKLINDIYHGSIDIEFVYQQIDDVPYPVSYTRTKPWGTGHALYSLRKYINNPFAIINADDYYGKEAFHQMADFLKNECDSKNYAMVGYSLENTLSLKGGVNRGICKIKDEKLESICEVKNIYWDGEILHNEQHVPITKDSICSMGFYGFHPSIFQHLEEDIIEFLKTSTENSEFLIPTVLEEKIKEGTVVTVLHSKDQWMGITYFEDLERAKKYFFELHKENIYPNNL
jgi:dTDP-glucose pyrophosphorylase